MGHAHNGILLSHKRNTFESVLMRGTNLEPILYTWSQSEREKQVSYVNAYTCNLEKWHWRPYLQGSSRDWYRDGPADTAGEVPGGAQQHAAHPLSHRQWPASGTLLRTLEAQTRCAGKPGREGRVLGGGFRRQGACVRLGRIHADVRQKPTRYCKATVLN